MPKTLAPAVVLLLTLSGCSLRGQLEDGYQLGDVRASAAESYESYCRPAYVPIRAVGRWMLRLIAYPVPELCR